ncbi:MAG: hypothetical protein ACTSVI_11015 [Promethearchaeota archaeon]
MKNPRYLLSSMENELKNIKTEKKSLIIKKNLYFLIIIFSTSIVLILLLMFSDPFKSGVLDFLYFFTAFDPALGALWAFIFMLIGNSTNIPVGIPATFFFAKSVMKDSYFWGNLFLYSFSAGAGAALGQLIQYVIGYGAAKVLKNNKGIKNLQHLTNKIAEHRFLAPFLIFIFALTPIPDQLLMIPLGTIKYNMKKTFIPSFLGKSFFSLTLAIGATIFNTVGETPTIQSFIDEIIFMSIIFSLLVLCISFNWEEIISRNSKSKGLKNKMAEKSDTSIKNENENELVDTP